MATQITVHTAGDKVYTMGDDGELYEWVVNRHGQLEKP